MLFRLHLERLEKEENAEQPKTDETEEGKALKASLQWSRLFPLGSVLEGVGGGENAQPGRQAPRLQTGAPLRGAGVRRTTPSGSPRDWSHVPAH